MLMREGQGNRHNEVTILGRPLRIEKDKVIQPDTGDEKHLLGNIQSTECQSFSGFTNIIVTKHNCSFDLDESETAPTKVMNNVTSMSLIAEQYGSVDRGTNSQANRAEYPRVPANKYYFKDASLPSFRVFEQFDYNGNYIAEPELRRPVGTDFYEVFINTPLVL